MSLKDVVIDWYCDRCNDYLNVQPGFHPGDGVWTCQKCGYVNEISYANVLWDDETLDTMSTEDLMKINDSFEGNSK